MRYAPGAPDYGWQHQQARAEWAPIVATGRVVCRRCCHTIDRGQAWDMGHDDRDPTRYIGPEHAHCNRRAGALKGNARRTYTSRRHTPPEPDPQPQSRRWG